MLNRFSLSVLLIVSIVIWGATLWIFGVELTWDHAKPYTITLAALTAVIAAWNKFLWRVWPFRYFVKTPDLRGTWKVTLRSTFRNPDTHQQIDAVVGYALIQQKHSHLSLRLMTQESTSRLLAYSFLFHEDGLIELTGVYQSDPEIHLRGTVSEIHYGAFTLRLTGKPTDRMKGHYWTDRNTTGSIDYVEHRPMLCERYETANELFVH